MGQTPLSRTPRQGGRAKSDGQHQNGVEDKESADSDKDRMSLSMKAHTHNGCSHQQHSVGEDLSLPKTPKPKKTQDHRDHKRRIPECHRIPLDIHSDTAQKHNRLHIDGPTSNNAKSEHSARAAGTTFFAETMLAPFFICLNDEGDEDGGPPPPSHNRVTVLSKPGPSRHG